MAGEFEGFSNINNNKKEISTSVKNLINQYKNKSKKKSIFTKVKLFFKI